MLSFLRLKGVFRLLICLKTIYWHISLIRRIIIMLCLRGHGGLQIPIRLFKDWGLFSSLMREMFKRLLFRTEFQIFILSYITIDFLWRVGFTLGSMLETDHLTFIHSMGKTNSKTLVLMWEVYSSCGCW